MHFSFYSSMAQELTRRYWYSADARLHFSAMNFITAIVRMTIGPPFIRLIEGLHVRLLMDWVANPDDTFIHPNCTWKLADGHPNQGDYAGLQFYTWHKNQLADLYCQWNEEVHDIIGSSIGGIVVGEYQFQHEPNGHWFTAPFTHFYQIQRGKIITVRCFMGKVSRFIPIHQSIGRPALLHFCSPN